MRIELREEFLDSNFLFILQWFSSGRCLFGEEKELDLDYREFKKEWKERREKG